MPKRASRGLITQIHIFERGSNRHRMWDSDTMAGSGTRKHSGWRSWPPSIPPRTARHGCAEDVEDWATESLLAARAAYLIPGTDRRLKPGQKLGEYYMKANLPVARQRLYQAGIRLASVLNEALGAGSPTASENQSYCGRSSGGSRGTGFPARRDAMARLSTSLETARPPPMPPSCTSSSHPSRGPRRRRR